jgi:hypothetical protein
VPTYTASIVEEKASLFVIERGLARKREVTILGEIGGALYIEPKELPAGTAVIAEGRALLSDGDPVLAKPDAPPPARSSNEQATRGGGTARPQ